jgi:hypothetical protein
MRMHNEVDNRNVDRIRATGVLVNRANSASHRAVHRTIHRHASVKMKDQAVRNAGMSHKLDVKDRSRAESRKIAPISKPVDQDPLEWRM